MSGDESSVVEGASALAKCAVTDAVRALRTGEEGNEEVLAEAKVTLNITPLYPHHAHSLP